MLTILDYINKARSIGLEVVLKTTSKGYSLSFDGSEIEAESFEGLESILIGDIFSNLEEAISAI